MNRNATFTRMWAVAVLAHMANQSLGLDVSFGLSLEGVVATGVVFACGFALYRPHGWSHLALASVQVLHVLVTAPYSADHWLIVALVNAAFIIAFVLERPGRDHPVTFLPAARLVFLITYGAAFVAKLNSGFLDPSTSCGVFLYEHLAQVFPLPGKLAWISIPATLLAEGCVAALLWHRATRRWGIVIGCIFHFAIAMSPLVRVFDFSCVVFALLVLFTHDSHTVLNKLLTTLRLDRVSVLFAKASPFLIGALCLFVAFASPAIAGASELGTRIISSVLVLGFAGYALVVCLWMIRANQGPSVVKIGGVSPATIASAALAALLAVSPYVGLRTVAAFTMYSNVRTELGESNHYVLPRVMLFRLQDDLVRIVGSDDEDLQAIADREELVHFVMLHRHVDARPSIRVEYERDGAVFEHAPDRPVADLSEPLSLWLRAYYLGRPVPETGSPRCQN